MVLLRQLARPLVEFGVAYLAVLRLLRGLGVGQLGAQRRLRIEPARPTAQRHADERGDREHDDKDDEQLHHWVVRASSRATRAA
jgi:hypothetical protein